MADGKAMEVALDNNDSLEVAPMRVGIRRLEGAANAMVQFGDDDDVVMIGVILGYYVQLFRSI